MSFCARLIIFSVLCWFLSIQEINPKGVDDSSLLGEGTDSAMVRDGKSSELQVTIGTDKASYKVGESIRLIVLLTNLSDSPIRLYGFLTWGESGSLSLWIHDANGKEIQRKFLDDSLLPPPKDTSQFAVLMPQHILGVVREETLEGLNLNVPGTYTLTVEYHSPISKELGLGLDFWSMEKGTITSESVRFEVRSSR